MFDATLPPDSSDCHFQLATVGFAWHRGAELTTILSFCTKSRRSNWGCRVGEGDFRFCAVCNSLGMWSGATILFLCTPIHHLCRVFIHIYIYLYIYNAFRVPLLFKTRNMYYIHRSFILIARGMFADENRAEMVYTLKHLLQYLRVVLLQ